MLDNPEFLTLCIWAVGLGIFALFCLGLVYGFLTFIEKCFDDDDRC